jgi:hypothetical protein
MGVSVQPDGSVFKQIAGGSSARQPVRAAPGPDPGLVLVLVLVLVPAPPCRPAYSSIRKN